MNRQVTLEVVSDLICPWCYIGKHRLARALELLAGEITATVRWRPYELNPHMPPEGMDRQSYCERKFGSLEYANRLYANVAANAHADGLPMAVERIARTPSTRAAHRLMELAHEQGLQDVLVDALFEAYFVDGRDIGDAVVLQAIAAATGLDAAAVVAALADGARDATVSADIRAAHELGVTGVPAFVYNGRLLFSGAQDPQTIALALERVVAKGL